MTEQNMEPHPITLRYRPEIVARGGIYPISDDTRSATKTLTETLHQVFGEDYLSMARVLHAYCLCSMAQHDASYAAGVIDATVGKATD